MAGLLLRKLRLAPQAGMSRPRHAVVQRVENESYEASAQLAQACRSACRCADSCVGALADGRADGASTAMTLPLRLLCLLHRPAPWHARCTNLAVISQVVRPAETPGCGLVSVRSPACHRVSPRRDAGCHARCVTAWQQQHLAQCCAHLPDNESAGGS